MRVDIDALRQALNPIYHSKALDCLFDFKNNHNPTQVVANLYKPGSTEPHYNARVYEQDGHHILVIDNQAQAIYIPAKTLIINAAAESVDKSFVNYCETQRQGG
jgi:hypothetical protein